MEDIEFMRRLNRHPHLKARMGALLNVAEASLESGEMTADEVEIQLREKVREIGQNTLQEWANSVAQQAAAKSAENKNFKRHGKKKFIGTQPLDK